MKSTRGFTLLEVLFSIAILAILFFITINSFGGEVAEKENQAIADNIVAKLELARSNAVTGKNGQNYGVKFGDNYFTYFTGSSYISSNQSNERTDIGEKFEITNDIPGADNAIVFSKLKGDINHSGPITITIYEVSNSENTIQLKIGKLGDVSMVK